MEAFDKGNFYASTGVELSDYEASAKQIKITIKEDDKNTRYRVQFIGRGGKVLKDESGNSASYDVQGNEQYVRAKVTDSNGKFAWTQPVMVQ